MLRETFCRRGVYTVVFQIALEIGVDFAQRVRRPMGRARFLARGPRPGHASVPVSPNALQGVSVMLAADRARRWPGRKRTATLDAQETFLATRGSSGCPGSGHPRQTGGHAVAPLMPTHRAAPWRLAAPACQSPR